MERRRLSTTIPSLVPETTDVALGWLLVPARHFRDPNDVLTDERLDLQENGQCCRRGHRTPAPLNPCRRFAGR